MQMQQKLIKMSEKVLSHVVDLKLSLHRLETWSSSLSALHTSYDEIGNRISYFNECIKTGENLSTSTATNEEEQNFIKSCPNSVANDYTNIVDIAIKPIFIKKINKDTGECVKENDDLGSFNWQTNDQLKTSLNLVLLRDCDQTSALNALEKSFDQLKIVPSAAEEEDDESKSIPSKLQQIDDEVLQLANIFDDIRNKNGRVTRVYSALNTINSHLSSFQEVDITPDVELPLEKKVILKLKDGYETFNVNEPIFDNDIASISGYKDEQSKKDLEDAVEKYKVGAHNEMLSINKNLETFLRRIQFDELDEDEKNNELVRQVSDIFKDTPKRLDALAFDVTKSIAVAVFAEDLSSEEKSIFNKFTMKYSLVEGYAGSHPSFLPISDNSHVKLVVNARELQRTNKKHVNETKGVVNSLKVALDDKTSIGEANESLKKFNSLLHSQVFTSTLTPYQIISTLPDLSEELKFVLLEEYKLMKHGFANLKNKMDKMILKDFSTDDWKTEIDETTNAVILSWNEQIDKSKMSGIDDANKNVNFSMKGAKLASALFSLYELRNRIDFLTDLFKTMQIDTTDLDTVFNYYKDDQNKFNVQSILKLCDIDNNDNFLQLLSSISTKCSDDVVSAEQLTSAFAVSKEVKNFVSTLHTSLLTEIAISVPKKANDPTLNPPNSSESEQNSDKNNNTIWIVLGCLGGAALIGAGVYFLIAKKKKNNTLLERF